MVYIIIAIIAYLIGSINFSVLISKKMAGFDVREKGSGNGGTTNVLRTVGKKAAIFTLLADILKGIVAILLAYLVGRFASSNKAILVQVASIFVVVRTYISHIFWISWWKRNCNKLRNIVIVKLGNRFNLFHFCDSTNGNNKDGFARIYFSSSFISNSYDIHQRTLFSWWKLFGFWHFNGSIYYI